METDDALVLLWYCGSRFSYLINGNSVVRQRDIKVVKKILKDHSCRGEKTVLKPAAAPADPAEKREYDFSSVGDSVDAMRYLTLDEIKFIHHELAKDLTTSIDPIAPAGIRDMGLLESALHHPQTGYDGKKKYPTIEASAAALMYAISNNHPFHNGNKRTALVALLVFLERYNISLTCNEDELFRLSLEVAGHKIESADSVMADAEIFALTKWIFQNCKKLVKGERPITRKRLIQILQDFECQFNPEAGRFERGVEASFLGLKRKTILTFKIPMAEIRRNDSVDKGLMRALRKALQLDAEHGIDLDSFYGGANYSASEFINKYRKLLNRLSKR